MNEVQRIAATVTDLTPEEAAVAEYLRTARPELSAAFLRCLPEARLAIMHRLVQCAVRENIAGLRERVIDRPEDSCLTVRLANAGELSVPVVRRLSLDRWDMGAPVTVRRGDRIRSVTQATDLLDLLYPEEETKGAEDGDTERSARRTRFRFELDNSTANYALALAGAEHRREKLATAAKQLGCRSSLEWAQRQVTNDDWSSLVFYEQWVVDGHPLHPGAKLKGGMAPADVVRYSPEWEGCPDVRIVAVHKTLCRVATFRTDGPADVLRREYPRLGPLVDHCLERLGLVPAQYEWIPVHPWQVEHTLPDLFAGEIERREVVMVPGASIPTAALMALRSLAPVGEGSRHKRHLKTAINVQTTGAVRTVSPQAAANGPMLSEVLAEVQRREAGFHGRFVVLLEDVGVHFQATDPELSPDQRTLLGKNLAAVMRENPEAHVRPNEIAMPGSALLAQSPLGAGPIVRELIARYALRHGLDEVSAIVPFLRAYAETTVPGMLTLMSRYGIGLEGHLQNCVLVFQDGTPVRMLVRDMGGVRILPERLAAQGLAVRFLPGSATLALDVDDLRNKVGYAFFLNHWGELIGCLMRTYEIEERACWQPLAAECSAVHRQLAADPAIADDVRADAAACFRSHIALKALTTMRLRGDVTKYSFSEVSNPLAEFAEPVV